MRPRLTILLLGLFLAVAGLLPAPAATEAPIQPGARLAKLTVGTMTYTDVQVRTLNARTVTITHAGGMASIHLRDLSPEWQARFCYDAAAEAAAERTLLAKTAEAARRPRALRPRSRREQLFMAFGQPVNLPRDVDLRPDFFQLELSVKSQGRRPSCAVFAIVSALEFESAAATGHAQKFSEEYLTWATHKTTHRVPPPAAGSTDDDEAASAAREDDSDTGFSLGEVVTALRAYGIPPQVSMPNTFGRKVGAIAEPDPVVVAEAREHQSVSVFGIPGRDPATRLTNVIHALDAGEPVVIGLAWPAFRSVRNGFLNTQTPVGGHAVTLVGYTGKSDRLEDVVFIFKNSWGVSWGQGGYGTATYQYLERNLGDAVILEVIPGSANR